MIRVEAYWVFGFSASGVVVGGQITSEHSAAIHHVTSHEDFADPVIADYSF